MTSQSAGVGDLGGAFARRSNQQASGNCPPPERLWDAVHGRLAAGECEAIVEHTVACPACAEDWRLALDLRREVLADAARPSTSPASRRWLSLAAAAAGLLLAGGLALRLVAPGPKAAYREPSGAPVHSLIAEDQRLPREHFVLRWSPGVAGARYNLRVSREDLEEVTRARGLAEPRFEVPASALSDIPDGTRLLWQVEVLSPGGERRLSPTFFARLE